MFDWGAHLEAEAAPVAKELIFHFFVLTGISILPPTPPMMKPAQGVQLPLQESSGLSTSLLKQNQEPPGAQAATLRHENLPSGPGARTLLHPIHTPVNEFPRNSDLLILSKS